MTTYRFDVAFLSGGASARFMCAGHNAGSEWRLARILVEAGMPDGPIEGGRIGEVDWTFHSLHRFAVGAVSKREAEAADQLHPALRTAVLAMLSERAARREKEAS